MERARPVERNGFGKTPAEAEPLLELNEQLFSRIVDRLDMYERWKQLPHER